MNDYADMKGCFTHLLLVTLALEFNCCLYILLMKNFKQHVFHLHSENVLLLKDK